MAGNGTTADDGSATGGGTTAWLQRNPSVAAVVIILVSAVVGFFGRTLALYVAAALVLVGTYLYTEDPNRLGRAISLGAVVGGIVMAVVVVVFYSSVFQ